MTFRAPWTATMIRIALTLLLSLAAAGPALAASPALQPKPSPPASGIADQGIAQQKGLRVPGGVFLSEGGCETAEGICRWYEDQSGDYCDYVWCMQYHIRLGLIPFSCLAGEAQLSASFC